FPAPLSGAVEPHIDMARAPRARFGNALKGRGELRERPRRRRGRPTTRHAPTAGAPPISLSPVRTSPE
ncbi:hypothetical protein ACFU7X_44805, partial [Streptomyces chartreusis]|uniref:hypothetical protein n=1 Tax=Streptomyces chartreusis TaxID=1969 RepID=UPI0036CE02A7